MKTIGILVRTALLVTVSCSASAAQAVQSGYVSVGPDRIYYEVAGAGPVVVLIHDGIVHCRVWDGQFLEFAKHFRVVRYDRRGYGHSPAPTVAHSRVDDLNSLFAQLKIERACLMGMSSGGMLAIDFALRFPQKVSSLVLVGAVVGGLSYTDHMLTRGGHRPDLPNDPEAHVRYFVTDDPYEIYAENKAAKAAVQELVTKYPRRRGIGDEGEPVPARPAYTRLGEITVPTLILVGEFDMPDVHAHAGAINAGIAGSRRIVVSRSGHLIPIEQPALFNEAVAPILQGLS